MKTNNKIRLLLVAVALVAAAPVYADNPPEGNGPPEIVDYAPPPASIPPKPPFTKSTLWAYLQWMALYG